VLLAAGLLVAGCGGGGEKTGQVPKHTVTGTVTYLQRVALPPDGEVVVSIQDVSDADRAPRTVARQVIPTKGKQVPVPFAIKYDSDHIDESHTYSLHVEIRVGGKPRFMTAQSYPVITRGAPKQVDVVVMAVEKEAPANSPLVGTYWRLVELGGRAVVAGAGPVSREPHLMLLEENHQAAATGGCNQMTAPYESSETSLRFGPIATTRMACPEGTDRDRALFAAMGATRGYRIEGDRLEITDAAGIALARFVAAALEE
jgi:putative lipoprotein